FENTLVALDATGELMSKVSGVFYTLTGAETNDQIQAIAKEVAPIRSNLRDDILMNPQLFERIKSIYDTREELDLDEEGLRLLEETYLDFVSGGAELSDADKAKMRDINTRLSTLGLQFSDNVLAETNGYQLFIDNEEDLAGLPPTVVAGAAEAAAKAGQEGKWLFTTHRPSIYPFLDYADNRELREQIFKAYIMRGDNNNEYDNKAILSEILALRAEKAKLLGYETHADRILERRMAKNPEAVYELLEDLWHPSLGVAREEAEALQAAIEADGFDFKLEPWDWRYYTEKVRRAKYDIDEQEVRQYFMIDNVIDGAFYVANQLYGIEFTEIEGIPTYHPEVRTYEVTDVDGSHLGVFMADYFPRPGKRGGAWSGSIRSQWVRDGVDVRPIVRNVGNFARPVGDAPALISLEQVHTLFHELGHGLQALLSNVQYRGSGGVTRDFVELPSQIMENWLLEPEVLKVYAKHYETGEVIPDELVAKIKAAEQFNQGFTSVEYLSACYLDMDWHTLEDPAGVDVNEFEKASMDKIGLIPEIVVRYRSTYFTHITGGYSAGYYSYVWSEVLDADAFEAFQETSLFDQETALAFRTNILERRGAEDPEVLYLRFRGREPTVEALLKRRGWK
ncbi:MAG: M3 family metallopeptidase, partial [Thermoanaerobaculales bacterium]|nr:M3 family metallopeptidase [Thermoanaerobaculales bacterium]